MLRSPEAPQLNLETSAKSTISTTLPYDIKFTVQRLADSPANPCIFRWSQSIYGLMRARFILLHDTVDGLKQIDVEQMRLPDRSGEEDEIVLDAKDHERLRELSSGAEMVWKSRLTSNYHMLLVPGEKYHLVWPGMEITSKDTSNFLLPFLYCFVCPTIGPGSFDGSFYLEIYSMSSDHQKCIFEN